MNERRPSMLKAFLVAGRVAAVMLGAIYLIYVVGVVFAMSGFD